MEWVNDYLTHHLQHVVVNGHSSGILPVKLLKFSVRTTSLLYLNDILNVDLHQDCTFHIYADNILFYHTIHSVIPLLLNILCSLADLGMYDV